MVHRVIGSPRLVDRSRCDIIARARNEGKRCGTFPWLMFLDDDVVLAPGCIAALADELEQRPSYAALGVDYLGERRFGRMARHVSLGATLFRRAALDQIEFAWRGEGCECQCCCDDLRRLKWRIDYSARVEARHLKAEAAGRPGWSHQLAAARITCMCVTRDRVKLLRRAIRSYLSQTHLDRELVVVHAIEDRSTRQYLAGLHVESIVPVAVRNGNQLSLGALRNIARQAGTGNFVAQWDDDDWSDPRRLELQMRTIRDRGKQGCVLVRQTLYDYHTGRAYVTFARPWENTIVVERSVLPAYPDLPKLEDKPVVEQLVHEGRLAKLDAPKLYVYTYHGKNTWDRRHWEAIVRRSQPVGMDVSRRIAELLGTSGDVGTPTFQEIQQPTAAALGANRGWMPTGKNGYALTAGALHRARSESIGSW